MQLLQSHTQLRASGEWNTNLDGQASELLLNQLRILFKRKYMNMENNYPVLQDLNKSKKKKMKLKKDSRGTYKQ